MWHIGAGLAQVGARFVATGVDGWLQGRTMYGGASTFLAYCAIRKAMPDLPVLRAGQIGFIAPVSADLEIAVSMLRQGKNVSQIQTDIYCADMLAHRAMWVFGSTRPANGVVAAAGLGDLVPFEECAAITVPAGRHFVHNLEMRHALAKDEEQPGTVRRWIRLKDRDGIDPVGELLLIGDALPPGSLRAMERQGPISSINWTFTLLGDKPATRDGWWLLETASNHMADGFDSETLRMWNADGVEVMRGLQSVAVFG
jgi:acyl-CoA thioesterase